MPKNNKPTGGDYEVGFGRPPPATRFQKGQSGNPKGRPRTPKMALIDPAFEPSKGMILAEAYRPVTVNENGKTSEIPVIQAGLRRLGIEAAKGDRLALKTLVQLTQMAEGEQYMIRMQEIEFWMTYKLDGAEKLARCDRLGHPYPDLVPHPDDVVFDERACRIKFTGPRTPEQKTWWERHQENLCGLLEEVQHLRSELAADSDGLILQSDLDWTEKTIDRLLEVTPKWRFTHPGLMRRGLDWPKQVSQRFLSPE